MCAWLGKRGNVFLVRSALILFLIFVISSCGPLSGTGEPAASAGEGLGEQSSAVEPPEPGSAEDENQPGMQADSPAEDQDQDEIGEIDISVTDQPLTCPKEEQLYYLEYSHIQELDLPGFYLREESVNPQAFFQVYIYADGTISSEGLMNVVDLEMRGYVEDCELSGTSQLSAEITGTCQGNVASLKIIEMRESYDLKSSCPDQQPIIPETFPASAPEVEHNFALNVGGDTYVLEQDIGMVVIYYSWTLIPGEGLGLVPLD